MDGRGILSWIASATSSASAGADLKRAIRRADIRCVAVPEVPPAQVRAHPNGSSRHADALVESYRRLAEVFHHVLSEQSLDTLLDRMADTLRELIPYDALHIYEADTTRRELIPVLARSDWENEIMRTRPAFGQGITGWAVDKREPVLANDAHLDSRVAFIPGTPAEPEALISIPLIARGSLKGALNVYRVGAGSSFAEDEFELAKWFGDAAALALDNAQVRARLEHQAQTDSLTGLFNHRNFHERLRAELHARAVHATPSPCSCSTSTSSSASTTSAAMASGTRSSSRSARSRHRSYDQRRRLPRRRRGVRWCVRAMT